MIIPNPANLTLAVLAARRIQPNPQITCTAARGLKNAGERVSCFHELADDRFCNSWDDKAGFTSNFFDCTQARTCNFIQDNALLECKYACEDWPEFSGGGIFNPLYSNCRVDDRNGYNPFARLCADECFKPLDDPVNVCRYYAMLQIIELMNDGMSSFIGAACQYHLDDPEMKGYCDWVADAVDIGAILYTGGATAALKVGVKLFTQAIKALFLGHTDRMCARYGSTQGIPPVVDQVFGFRQAMAKYAVVAGMDSPGPSSSGSMSVHGSYSLVLERIRDLIGTIVKGDLNLSTLTAAYGPKPSQAYHLLGVLYQIAYRNQQLALQQPSFTILRLRRPAVLYNETITDVALNETTTCLQAVNATAIDRSGRVSAADGTYYDCYNASAYAGTAPLNETDGPEPYLNITIPIEAQTSLLPEASDLVEGNTVIPTTPTTTTSSLFAQRSTMEATGLSIGDTPEASDHEPTTATGGTSNGRSTTTLSADTVSPTPGPTSLVSDSPPFTSTQAPATSAAPSSSSLPTNLP